MPATPEDYLAALYRERAEKESRGLDTTDVDDEIARVTPQSVKRTAESAEQKRAVKRVG